MGMKDLDLLKMKDEVEDEKIGSDERRRSIWRIELRRIRRRDEGDDVYVLRVRVRVKIIKVNNYIMIIGP